MSHHLDALHALAIRRRGLGDPLSDVISLIAPQINERIDKRSNEVKAAALVEIDKKGSEASMRALIGGFFAGLVGVGVGYGIARAVDR